MAKNKPIEIVAKIEKVSRSFGKSDAQIVMTIPADQAGKIVLGDVKLTIEVVQKSLSFGGDEDIG